MDHQDLDIINGIKSGDQKAFEKLFFEYYTRLTGFAIKYVSDTDTAREVVQDVFVRIYESREKLVIQSSIKSYLYTSVRNACINFLNQRKLHASHQEIIMQNAQQPTPDFTDSIDQAELEYLIWQEVSALPDQCRRIFKLSRNEEIKNKEIAERLNISIRTVETQITKALRVLRKNLKPYLKIFF